PSQAPAASSVGKSASSDVLPRLIDLVASKTGYPKDLLDPNLDMEADLGIDTVKQAELFGAIRDAYGLPLEEGILIKDYPTLAKVAGYVQTRLGGQPAPPPQAQSPQNAQNSQTSVVSAGSVSAPAATAATSLDESAVLQKVIQLVSAKTGYPADMLEPDLDMEADLGIDTVKQAEL